jgi:cellulose 1,4-beta-cellobiosidase
MDIWEANSISTAYTPHVCDAKGPYKCSGVACGDDATGQRYQGNCDKDGCDFNSYRMGDTSFYGPGKKVDTTKKFTIVTQFITTDGTSTGTLKEIKRFYVQNGVVIPNSQTNIAGIDAVNSITDAFCNQQKTVFGDTNTFEAKGGLAGMGAAISRGMVLVLSIWDDHAVNMLWLDSTYPTDSTKLGAARGSCAITSGKPTEVEVTNAGASVTYSNIKIGPLGSTYSGTTGSVSSSSVAGSSSTKSSSAAGSSTKTSTSTTKTSTSSPPATSTATTGGTVPKWGQCGGQGWTGGTTCIGSTCTFSNTWYSQCL